MKKKNELFEKENDKLEAEMSASLVALVLAGMVAVDTRTQTDFLLARLLLLLLLLLLFWQKQQLCKYTKHLPVIP